jgi:hypothetical protein
MDKILLTFLKEKGIETKPILVNLALTSPFLFEQKSYKRNFGKFPMKLNKDDINAAFPKIRFKGADNIICLELNPGKKRKERCLKKNFPLYASQIYRDVPNCDGIWFKIGRFSGDLWLSSHGFRIIKKEYPKLFLILGINFVMIKNVGLNPQVLAKKIISYQEYVDAIYFDINRDQLCNLSLKMNCENFFREIEKELQKEYKLIP